MPTTNLPRWRWRERNYDDQVAAPNGQVPSDVRPRPSGAGSAGWDAWAVARGTGVAFGGLGWPWVALGGLGFQHPMAIFGWCKMNHGDGGCNILRYPALRLFGRHSFFWGYEELNFLHLVQFLLVSVLLTQSIPSRTATEPSKTLVTISDLGDHS